MHLCGGQHLSSFTIQSYITKFPVDDVETVTVTVYVTTGIAEVLIMALNSLTSFCHQYHVYSSVILFLDLLHSWVLYAISFTDTCTCICFLMHSVNIRLHICGFGLYLKSGFSRALVKTKLNLDVIPELPLLLLLSLIYYYCSYHYSNNHHHYYLNSHSVWD